MFYLIRSVFESLDGKFDEVLNEEVVALVTVGIRGTQIGVDITQNFDLTQGQSFQSCRCEWAENLVPECSALSKLKRSIA